MNRFCEQNLARHVIFDDAAITTDRLDLALRFGRGEPLRRHVHGIFDDLELAFVAVSQNGKELVSVH